VLRRKLTGANLATMTKVQQAVAALIKLHGSLRKAQAATGINYAYLQRLHKGDKVNPSDAVLAKLGLRKRSAYADLAQDL
jgi:hypothetical protein